MTTQYILKNTYLHGISFHHFYDNKVYLKGQGALNKTHLRKLIKFIGHNNIISPDEFIERIQKKKFNEKKVCFTFDDGLRCQYEIAQPILEEYNIRAFFFCFTSSLTNKPDLLEVYRYFRIKYFKNINAFYNEFFLYFEELKGINIRKIYSKHKNKIEKNKKIYKFHSKEDLLFRIIRDNYCGEKIYEKIMFALFRKYNFSVNKVLKKLYMNISQIKKLHKFGHKIGAHSHNHFTNIKKLSYDIQFKDYKKNISMLSNITNSQIDSMSHPCGSYNNNTFKIIKKLGIKYGFDSYLNNKKKLNNYDFFIARQDHSNIFKKLKIDI